MTHVQMGLNELTLEAVDPDASGDDVVAEPMFSRFNLTVELSSAKVQRYTKDKLKVLLVDERTGEVLMGAHGFVQAVSFPVFKKDGFEWTERVHKVKFTQPLQLDAQ